MSSRSKAEFIIRRIEEEGPKLSPRVKELIKRVIEEAEKELGTPSVSASPDTQRVDPEVITYVSRKPGLLRLLKILHDEGPKYTRELLGKLKMWEDGQRLIREAENLGLIKRKWQLCPGSETFRRRCLYNYITSKGIEVLRRLGYVE